VSDLTPRVGSGDDRVRADVTSGEIRIAPGEGATVEVEVTNVSEVIRAFRVGVLGLDPRWAVAEAVDLELFPGERRATVLSFELPPTFPAGRRRIAIEVTEPDTPDGSVVVVDVDVVVEPRDELSFGVEPSSLTVGPEGTFVMTPVNSGNTTLDLDLVAADPERKVKVTFDPPRPRLLPGERGVVRATARGPRPWFGMPLVRVLEFRIKGGTAEAFTAAAFIQTPRLSRRAVTLAGLVVVATLFAFVIFLSFSSVADLSAQQEALLKQSLGEDQPIGVRIEPSSIEGRVVSTTGGGIDGVSVELYTPANPLVPAKSTVTDVQGAYRFGSLVPDTYFVRFQVAGFGETWFRRGVSIQDATAIDLVAGQDLVDVNVALGGQPGSVSGTIVGEDVDGALVVAQIPGTSFEGSDLAPTASRLASVAVDATGTFTLANLPTPAGYEIVVTKAGFAPQVRTIALEPGEDRRDLEILLRRGGGVIAGTVVDLAGSAIPGALVVVSDGQTQVTTRTLSEADALGVFDIRELPTPGTYSLTVTADGFFTETQTILLGQDQRLLDRRVVLTASAGAVTGRVVSSAGVPLGGIDVTVLGPGLRLTTQTLSVPVGWDPAVDGAPSRRFDADGVRVIDENGYPVGAGTFRMAGLPLPGAYTVSFSGSGVVTQAVSVELTPGAGALRTLAQTTLDRSTGTIQGRIRSTVADGDRPLSAQDGVVVTLRSSALTRTALPTDLPTSRRGAFRFDDVPPGAYTLTVTRPGSPNQTILVNTTSRPGFSFDFATDSLTGSGSAFGPIRIEQPAVIAGRIVPFNGFIGARAYDVRVFRADVLGVPILPPVRTDLEGRFSIAGLEAPGFYVLEFTDRTTGEVHRIPNPGQRTSDDNRVFLVLEPGTATDVNREMRGAIGATQGFFFPFVTTLVRPTGPITADLLSERPSCTQARAGEVYLAVGAAELSYCSGADWGRAGPFEGTEPALGTQLQPGDADYPGLLTVFGPAAPHGPAAKLAFLAQPLSTTWQLATESATLGTITVELQDEQGLRITTGPAASASVALTLVPSGGVLSGETAIGASAGRASFTGLRVARASSAGSAYALRADGFQLPSVNSSPFVVAAIPPGAPTIVMLDPESTRTAPIVNWGGPFTDGGSSLIGYLVRVEEVSGGAALPDATIENGEGTVPACGGGSPVALSGLSGVPDGVYYFRSLPGPLTCQLSLGAGGTTPVSGLGTDPNQEGIRFRVTSVNGAGLTASSGRVGGLP
jgi:hypothetical protein